MSVKFTDRIDRRVIPRWHESSTVAKSGELAPLRERTINVSFDRELSRLKREIKENPLPGVAADALSIAFLSGDMDLAAKAKDILRKHESVIPNSIRRVIGTIQDTVDDAEIVQADCSSEHHQVAIRRIRQLLQQYQNNPILYLDLARNQAVLGLREKAERSILTALTLAPNHRHVLRAASRFYINEEQTEVAHRLLANSPATPHDPWLMAAEIATAQVAGRVPKFFKAGKLLLERQSLKPVHLSELAAAVGTVDLLDGRKKDVRRQFQIAMLSPTENSLAQVKWAEDKTNTVFSAGKPCIPGANEAAFIKAYYHNHDIRAAMENVDLWFRDEPFSPVAAMMHSYMGSLLDDYTSIIRVCDLGLRSNPMHSCLMSNKIFAEISSGDVLKGSDAQIEPYVRSTLRYLVSEANKKDADVAHALANIGLLLYRLGDIEGGRRTYEQAALWAKRKGEMFSAANAVIFHAREAILAGTEWADGLLREATDAVAKVNSSGQKFYVEKLKALSAEPNKASEILNPSAAEAYLPKRPKPKEGVAFQILKNADGTVTLVLPNRVRPQVK